jgi:hypothetical protein
MRGEGNVMKSRIGLTLAAVALGFGAFAGGRTAAADDVFRPAVLTSNQPAAVDLAVLSWGAADEAVVTPVQWRRWRGYRPYYYGYYGYRPYYAYRPYYYPRYYYRPYVYGYPYYAYPYPYYGYYPYAYRGYYRYW